MDDTTPQFSDVGSDISYGSSAVKWSTLNPRSLVYKGFVYFLVQTNPLPSHRSLDSFFRTNDGSPSTDGFVMSEVLPWTCWMVKMMNHIWSRFGTQLELRRDGAPFEWCQRRFMMVGVKIRGESDDRQ